MAKQSYMYGGLLNKQETIADLWKIIHHSCNLYRDNPQRADHELVRS